MIKFQIPFLADAGLQFIFLPQFGLQFWHILFLRRQKSRFEERKKKPQPAGSEQALGPKPVSARNWVSSLACFGSFTCCGNSLHTYALLLALSPFPTRPLQEPIETTARHQFSEVSFIDLHSCPPFRHLHFERQFGRAPEALCHSTQDSICALGATMMRPQSALSRVLFG